MWVETDGWKKQVLVIQTIVPPEILLPDLNQVTAKISGRCE